MKCDNCGAEMNVVYDDGDWKDWACPNCGAITGALDMPEDEDNVETPATGGAGQSTQSQRIVVNECDMPEWTGDPCDDAVDVPDDPESYR